MKRRQFCQTAAAFSLAGLPQAVLAAEQGDRDSVADLTEKLNPQIQHARDAALGILKPTAAQLERGLRLHAESLVFDAYGFSPRAAVDGEALAAAVAAGASDIELNDLREEMSMTRYVTNPVEEREYRDAWRASGVTCIFQNGYPLNTS